MRVVFLGNAPWSVPSLEALAASPHRTVLVLTRSARPAGRGSRLQRTPVAEAAERLGLPLMEVDTVKSGPGLEALRAAAPELLVVVAYGEILPADVLAVPSVAPVNVHFSLLPQLRGAAPVQRAILEGPDRTGVTTIRMDEGVDTGSILMQAAEPIRPDDDSGSLGQRLAELGGELLVKTLDGLASGELKDRPQDESMASYAKKLGAEDRLVDWTQDADAIVRRVRALAPETGAETRFRGRVLKVLRASRDKGVWVAPVVESTPLRPGQVFVGDKAKLGVMTGRGWVALEEVQPEGKRRMSGEEFVRGYRPEPGEILG